MTCTITASIGAYLLGAVEYGEWTDIDSHLLECEVCRAEVVRLAGLPGLLGHLPLDDVIVGDADLALSAPIRAPRRFPRRARTWLAVGVALVLAVGGTATGIAATRTTTRTALPHSWPHTFALTGSNPTTRVQGGASLTAESWGTEIWVKLQGVPPRVQCELVVHARDGRTTVGGTWSSDSTSAVWMPASAPFRPSEIVSLEIATPVGDVVTLASHTTERPS